jgi:hypothetical protein
MNFAECLGIELNALECSRVPWNAAECHGVQPSTTKSIIVICTVVYINIVFVQDINTMFLNNPTMMSSWQVSELSPSFLMPL